MSKILVVEDDQETAKLLVYWLEKESYDVALLTSGADALQMLNRFPFDVIVMDWGLPDLSGYEVLTAFRHSGGNTPVLFLTGRADINSKTNGLEAGADDYLTKPFDPRELIARVRALLRRPSGLLPAKIRIGNVTMELETKRIFVGEKLMRLTTREFSVLEFLMKHPNQVFSAKALLDSVWPTETESSEDAVRACVLTLRRKIAVGGSDCIVKTVTGAGYTVESGEERSG